MWPRLSGSRAPVSLHLSAAWLQLHVPGSCWRHAATWPVSTPTQPGPHTASGRTLGTWALVKTPACHSLVTTCHVSRVMCHVSPEQGGGCGEEGEDCTDQDADEPLELDLLGSQRLGLEQQTR